MGALGKITQSSTLLYTMMERSKKRLSMWKLRRSENAMTLSNLGDERALDKMKKLLAPDQDRNINRDRDPLTTIQRIQRIHRPRYVILSKNPASQRRNTNYFRN